MKLTETPRFDLRYTYITDISKLRQWLKTPGMLHWFPMETEGELENAIQCWIGFCRWSSSLTATVDHTPVGIGTLFLMPYKKVAHQALFKMVVDPAWQRQGIGTALIRNLKHLAKNYFHLELLNIEIYEDNPIYQLLKNADFYEVLRQPHFVREEEGYRARVLMEVAL